MAPKRAPRTWLIAAVLATLAAIPFSLWLQVVLIRAVAHLDHPPCDHTCAEP